MKSAVFSQSDFSSLPEGMDKTIFSVMAADIANKKVADLSLKVVQLLNVVHELDLRSAKNDFGYAYHEDLKARNKLLAELEVFIVNGGVWPRASQEAEA